MAAQLDHAQFRDIVVLQHLLVRRDLLFEQGQGFAQLCGRDLRLGAGGAGDLGVGGTRLATRPDLGELGAGERDLGVGDFGRGSGGRSEEHTSELQSLMRISYAVFCLKKKKTKMKKTESSQKP